MPVPGQNSVRLNTLVYIYLTPIAYIDLGKNKITAIMSYYRIDNNTLWHSDNPLPYEVNHGVNPASIFTI